jgi:hypothetical protein
MLAFFFAQLLYQSAVSSCATRLSGSYFARQHLKTNCADVTNCVFFDLTGSGDGGAIMFDACTDVTMSSCLFVNCAVVEAGLDDFGGAVYVDASTFSAARICAVRCRAEQGQAIWIEKPPQWPRIRQSAFNKCSERSDEDADQGAISCTKKTGLKVEYTNFTDCHIWPWGTFRRYGSAICVMSPVMDSSDRTSIDYCMFDTCGGRSTVDLATGLGCDLGWAFHCDSGSSRIYMCVFRNLSNDDAGICLYDIASGYYCSIEWCYFYPN